MELSPKIIERLASQAFPQATLIAHRLLESESASQNYAVELHNPTTEIVLRTYPPEVSKSQIEKEMYVLQVVMPETGVPTARVIHFDDSRTIIDRPYAVLNLLPGEPLAKALPRMDELDQETVGYEMGRYLAKLHSIPLEKFGEFLGQDPSASTSEKTYTVGRVAEWLSVCEENDLLDDSAIAALRAFVGQTRVLDRREACFVHGSYHERNINVEEGIAGFHVIGVFNFEQAQGWSPEWDMAHLSGHIFDDYPSLAKGFLDGYADTASLSDTFWHRLGIYEQVVNIRYVTHGHLAGNESLLKTHLAQLRRFLEGNTS